MGAEKENRPPWPGVDHEANAAASASTSAAAGNGAGIKMGVISTAPPPAGTATTPGKTWENMDDERHDDRRGRGGDGYWAGGRFLLNGEPIGRDTTRITLLPPPTHPTTGRCGASRDRGDGLERRAAGVVAGHRWSPGPAVGRTNGRRGPADGGDHLDSPSANDVPSHIFVPSSPPPQLSPASERHGTANAAAASEAELARLLREERAKFLRSECLRYENRKRTLQLLEEKRLLRIQVIQLRAALHVESGTRKRVKREFRNYREKLREARQRQKMQREVCLQNIVVGRNRMVQGEPKLKQGQDGMNYMPPSDGTTTNEIPSVGMSGALAGGEITPGDHSSSISSTEGERGPGISSREKHSLCCDEDPSTLHATESGRKDTINEDAEAAGVMNVSQAEQFVQKDNDCSTDPSDAEDMVESSIGLGAEFSDSKGYLAEEKLPEGPCNPAQQALLGDVLSENEKGHSSHKTDADAESCKRSSTAGVFVREESNDRYAEHDKKLQFQSPHEQKVTTVWSGQQELHQQNRQNGHETATEASDAAKASAENQFCQLSNVEGSNNPSTGSASMPASETEVNNQLQLSHDGGSKNRNLKNASSPTNASSSNATYSEKSASAGQSALSPVTRSAKSDVTCMNNEWVTSKRFRGKKKHKNVSVDGVYMETMIGYGEDDSARATYNSDFCSVPKTQVDMATSEPTLYMTKDTDDISLIDTRPTAQSRPLQCLIPENESKETTPAKPHEALPENVRVEKTNAIHQDASENLLESLSDTVADITSCANDVCSKPKEAIHACSLDPSDRLSRCDSAADPHSLPMEDSASFPNDVQILSKQTITTRKEKKINKMIHDRHRFSATYEDSNSGTIEATDEIGTSEVKVLGNESESRLQGNNYDRSSVAGSDTLTSEIKHTEVSTLVESIGAVTDNTKERTNQSKIDKRLEDTQSTHDRTLDVSDDKRLLGGWLTVSRGNNCDSMDLSMLSSINKSVSLDSQACKETTWVDKNDDRREQSSPIALHETSVAFSVASAEACDRYPVSNPDCTRDRGDFDTEDCISDNDKEDSKSWTQPISNCCRDEVTERTLDGTSTCGFINAVKPGECGDTSCHDLSKKCNPGVGISLSANSSESHSISKNGFAGDTVKRSILAPTPNSLSDETVSPPMTRMRRREQNSAARTCSTSKSQRLSPERLPSSQIASKEKSKTTEEREITLLLKKEKCESTEKSSQQVQVVGTMKPVDSVGSAQSDTHTLITRTLTNSSNFKDEAVESETSMLNLSASSTSSANMKKRKRLKINDGLLSSFHAPKLKKKTHRMAKTR